MAFEVGLPGGNKCQPLLALFSFPLPSPFLFRLAYTSAGSGESELTGHSQVVGCGGLRDLDGLLDGVIVFTMPPLQGS